jgi:iturin family lipopeptide synthetase A
MEKYTGLEIAVIGMSGRFPEADSIAQYWDNLKNGKDCISDFSDEEVLEEGEDETLVNDPAYVKSNAYLKNKKYFDSEFFGYTPHEAELMDPQVRIYHECCWEALEDSGYSPGNSAEKIGVFSAGSPNIPWVLFSAKNNQEGFVDGFTASHLRDATFLSSRISYKFNLKGPAIFVQTACSSSLVAIHQACNSLLLGECGMALGGGVNILNYSKKGYLYKEGMIHSQDGRCRPFDAKSSGTVGGEGAGVVVLKRLKDAIRDRDNIYAIIKGTAINNDGADKVGYTAPSVKGQADVIRRAHKMAKIEQDSIGYIETHGTATSLGDTIEIEALNEVFGSGERGTCAIGSVKSNIGHLDTAASVAGFIKTVLAIKNKSIPASLHFTEANPKIDFTGGPFYVNNTLKQWDNQSGPLRAGVSSFGIGGTNAHIVLQEAPKINSPSKDRKTHLIVLSAKTKASLERYTDQFTNYLKNDTDANLSDIAYTLQLGRDRFKHRKIFVCDQIDNAIKALSINDTIDWEADEPQEDLQNIIFMFPGQGAQYAGMCYDLYHNEKIFRNKVDECLTIAKQYTNADLESLLFMQKGDIESINSTENAQPLLFIIEYCMAHLFISWGIKPDYMIGHSIGEYTAACLSGVFSLKDAIGLVIRRGELMSKAEKGSMLSISASRGQLKDLLDTNESIDLAVLNSDSSVVVSGNDPDILKFKNIVEQEGIQTKKIHTSHAFHSHMMESILEEFEHGFSEITFNEPQIPYISNLTGEIVTFQEISKPSYWSKHLRGTVNFLKGTETLLKKGCASFIEIGPGRTLCNYVNENKLKENTHHVINVIRHSKQETNDQKYLLGKLGQLWLHGIKIDWKGFYANEERRRVSIPTYSFERTAYTTDFNLNELLNGKLKIEKSLESRDVNTNLINLSFWKPTLSPNKAVDLLKSKSDFLIFSGNEIFSTRIIKNLIATKQRVIQVKSGKAFKQLSHNSYEVNLSSSEDMIKLYQFFEPDQIRINNIIYCLSLTEEFEPINYEVVDSKLNSGYIGLSNIAKSLASRKQSDELKITVIGNHLVKVIEDDEIDPLKTVINAPARIIPSEFSNVKCKVIDIPYPFQNDKELTEYSQRVENELFYDTDDHYVAYRFKERWVQDFEKLAENSKIKSDVEIVSNGTYLIVGGLGGIGFSIANDLVLRYGSNVILVHRSDFPNKEIWSDWLQTHEEEDSTSKKILQIHKLEESGATIDLHQVDVTHKVQVEQFSNLLIQKEKTINGLIWAAGEVDYGGIIQNRSKENFIKYSASKIQGLLLFEKFFDFNSLDFLAMFSSVGNVVYQVKFGQVAYNAGNEFLENYAHYARKKMGIHAFTINWCDWLDVGLTVESIRKAEKLENIQLINSKISNAIYPKDGLEIFFKCLKYKSSVFTIHTQNLNEAIVTQREHLKNVKRDLIAPSFDKNEPIETIANLGQTLEEIYSVFFGKSVRSKDDFFELGGDSLKAMSLAARINQKLGSNLLIGDIYRYPTINELLTKLDDTTTNQVQIIPRAPLQEYYKVSSEQQRMYFLQIIDLESVLYNETEVLWALGEFDKDKVESAFRTIIARHESLRTRMILLNDELKQTISNDFEFELEYLEYDENKLDEIVQSFIRPFDLSEVPLLRVGIVKKGSHEHLIIMDSHHIVMDGVSRFVVREEFNSLYDGQELPPLKLQYKDYAQWQQTDVQRKIIEQQRNFWINEFSSEYQPFELPNDFKRSVLRNYEGDFVRFGTSINQTKKLKKIAASQGATVYTVLVAALNILLSKLTNQEDIVIGTPVAGRENADLEHLIGMFVNTICLRNYPQGNKYFNEFLTEVKSKSLACFENQSYQFEELINDIKLDRDESRNPLFDVMFVYQNYEESKQKMEGLTLKPENYKHASSRFDLTLLAVDEEDQLFFRFIYSTELFKKETAERFVAYFERIINSIVENDNILLSDIEIISVDEREKLLIDFNDTSVEVPKGKTILDLFSNQVAKTPNNIALIHDDTSLSYIELSNKANTIAKLINTKLTGQNHKIGLLFNHSIEMVACILGVIKAGCAYVPLSSEDPEERKQYILSNCDASLLIIQKELYSEMTSLSLIDSEKLVIVSDISETEGNEQLTKDPISPEDLIYVIYTSGTTGQPKGVEIRHKSLVNYALWNIDYHKLTTQDVGLQLVSYHFDGFGSNFYPALLSGGALVTIPNALKLETNYITNLIRTKRVTHFAILPGLYDAILNEFDPEEKLDLRYVVLAGEKSTIKLVNKSKYILPYVSLENEYGPTETTIGTSHSHELNEDSISIIGKPIWNTCFYILGGRNELLPIGIKGEICISGEGIAKGYISNEELTSEKFIDNPFVPNQKIYKTGDLGRWLQNGVIELVGRIDDQIKIRGFRVELGEIGNHISAFDEIQESAVFTGEKEGDKYLVAYYLSEKEVNETLLRSFLNTRIPDYMIPHYFVRLEEFPYTLNGKLDKKSLPEPQSNVQNFVAASSFEEQLLIDVWSKVLSNENIGVTDNFYSVGGDSIKSIQISSRLRSSGYEVSVRDILTGNNIRALAPKLKAVSTVSHQFPVIGQVALSPIQHWFVDKTRIDHHHFNQSVLINFKDGITEEIVKTIFNKLQEHHDALRIVCEFDNDRLKLINKPVNDFPVSLNEFDLEIQDDPESILLIESEKIQSGIDLKNGPLLKLGLFHMVDGSRLLIVAHHLVIDGVSWRIIFEDIEMLYQQIIKNIPLNLPLKTDSFQSWSKNLLGYTKSQSFERGNEYWNTILSRKFEPLKRDFPDGDNTYALKEMYSFQLSNSETARLLSDVHTPFKTQINDILLTALLLSVKKMFNINEILIDLEGHGREDLGQGENVSRTVGWFTSFYPVLLEKETGNLASTIKHVKESLRKVPNNGIDFLLKQYYKPSDNKFGNSESQISFNYLGQFDSVFEGSSFTVANEDNGNEVSQNRVRDYGWDISGIITNGKLSVGVMYSKAQYKKATINSLMSYYEEYIREIIDYCCSYGKVELSPSDLTITDFALDKLNDLQEKYELQDIYPLSPMQEGMFFHSLLKSGSTSYFGQMSFEIDEDLDLDAIEKSINDLIARHDIFRTIFFSEGFERPIQLVVKERRIKINYNDIRQELIDHDVHDVIENYQQKERSNPFDLSSDVLMRLRVLRTDESHYALIWNYHHILMDGWCTAIILNEFREIYSSNKRSQQIKLPAVNAYMHYIEWLEGRNKDNSVVFWENYLNDYQQLASMPKKEHVTTQNTSHEPDFQYLKISKENTCLLHQVTKEYGVTINTVIQCTWGMLLAKYNNTDDVVFGTVVSGRPAEVEGIENMIGLFINTIPVRVKFSKEDGLGDILLNIQNNALAKEHHQYHPLSEIQALSPLGRGLLDHIIIVENYPVLDDTDQSQSAINGREDFPVSNVQMHIQSNYDLVLVVTPGDEIEIKLEYNTNVYERETIDNILGHLNQVFQQILVLKEAETA